MKQTLHFVIDADWVTDFARTCYWNEHRFDYARELIASIDGLSEKNVDEILLGEKRLTGRSDGEIKFIDDKSDFNKTKQDMVDLSIKVAKNKAKEFLDNEKSRIAREVFDYAERHELKIETRLDFDRVQRLMNDVGYNNVKIHKYNFGVLSQFTKDIRPLFPNQKDLDNDYTVFDHTQEHLKDIEIPIAFGKPKDDRTVQDIRDITEYYNKVADAERKRTEELNLETAKLKAETKQILEDTEKIKHSEELEDYTIKTPFGNIDENTTLEELQDIQEKQNKATKFIKDFVNKEEKEKWKLPYGEPSDVINADDGWISPEGMFYPMGFQTHLEFCYDIIEYEKEKFGKVFTEKEEVKGQNDLMNIGFAKISSNELFLPYRSGDGEKYNPTEKQMELCLNAKVDVLPNLYSRRLERYRKEKKIKISKKMIRDEIKHEFRDIWELNDALDKKLIKRPYRDEIERLNDMFVSNERNIIEDLKKRGAKNIIINEKSFKDKVYCKEYIVNGED